MILNLNIPSMCLFVRSLDHITIQSLHGCRILHLKLSPEMFLLEINLTSLAVRLYDDKNAARKTTNPKFHLSKSRITSPGIRLV